MKRWKVVTLVALILLASAGAGFFDFAELVNPYLARLPGGFQIPEVPFRLGLDLQGGVHLLYQADLSQVREDEYDSSMEALRDIIERRVNIFGVAEPLVQTQGRGAERRLIVELAGVVDSAEAVELIGRAPLLKFYEPKENYEEIIEANTKAVEEAGGLPEGMELEDPFRPTALDGSLLDRADTAFNNLTQEPYIALTFNKEGAKLFEEITSRTVGKPLPIYLDGQVIQSPIVQAAIAGGRAQITGSFTLEEVRSVVRDLNAGAIPVSIDLLSQQVVGPTLGKRSLEQSMRAAALGFVAVFAFMILVYRIPGVLAGVALVSYSLFLLLLFKLFGFTLTLAGIAGAILSIGMAVDANVLIFSRFREELRAGKHFSAAIEEGFRRAWPSIRDGNVTTLLVAMVLFWFGTSFVKGFALALSIGILLSMFSAIVVTKSFLRLFLRTPLEKVLWLWK